MNTLGAVGNHIKDKDCKYKAKYKAQKLSKCKLREFDGVVINKLSVDKHDRLKVELTKDSKTHTFFYQNPPILVDAGTVSLEDVEVVKIVNEQNVSVIEKQEQEDFIEDLEQSLKEMVIDTLRIINK